MQATPIHSGAHLETYSAENTNIDYSSILNFYGLTYNRFEYYFQVGEIKKTQGWILHLSVILSQMTELLEVVVPYLSNEKVPFKIIINQLAGEDLLSGYFGAAQIGKVVSIYPEDDLKTIKLAKTLIEITKPYKGPAIPTDICLGSVVYTRYGSFNPVIKTNPYGIEIKYIYDIGGQLTADSYSMPFELPTGIEWPFKELSNPIPAHLPKSFNGIYKVLELLKSDPRGSVFKGLYVKSIFQVKNCVMKQGFTNSISDMFGRDIRDRLIWQFELYKDLSNIIPMPVIYDLIDEERFGLLIMQYISGDSLYQKAQDINPRCKSSNQLTAELLSLIDYAIEITQIIGRLHKKGYVHRDIVPVNFLIDKKNRVFLIDMELAYSFELQRPYPPFRLGTAGFMSPEQEATKTPSIAQDIYSLGATLLYLFTGLTPIKFNTEKSDTLKDNLTFFIANSEMAEIIAETLNHEPSYRPSISDILGRLHNYRNITSNYIRSKNHDSAAFSLNENKLRDTISAAIKGLLQAPVLSGNDLWLSKRLTSENHSAMKNVQYYHSPGLAEGIAGPLYLLARLNKVGIDIEDCKERFTKSWKYLEQAYFTSAKELPADLTKGAAGLAIALSEGISSGLLKRNSNNMEMIQRWLSLPNEMLDLSSGVAGQGIAILRCADLLGKEMRDNLLRTLAAHILTLRRTTGNWLPSFSTTFDFNHDQTGILWFLFQYHSRFPDHELNVILNNSLKTLLKDKSYMKRFSALTATRECYELGDGGKGLILLLLKAYEVSQADTYKRLAQSALYKYPPQVVHTNFTQRSGLAGLGEVYLEAWRVLRVKEWKDRADRIANVFIHTFFMNAKGSGYWKTEENNPPTADLLSGMSGIIHFLSRCLYPSEIGYRILD